MKAPKFRVHVDSVIMTVAGLTLAISIFFLFEDGYLFQDSNQANLQKVGTFKTSQNDVRRRVDSGMAWSNVDAPDKVYEGDSIFTGDKSDASILLDNGTLIKVDPKSLVVIHTKGNKTEIDLQYGSLQGKIASADPIIITQNGKSQQLDGANGSEVRVVKTAKSKSVHVQVTKGQVKVDNKDVNVDEMVSLSDEKPVIQKATITLLSPTDGHPKWLPMGGSLGFKWKMSGVPAGQHVKVQFSRDDHFDQPFYTADVTSTQLSVADTNLPQGSFYWRVKPDNGEPSLSTLATTYPDVPPLPVLPKESQDYVLDGDKGETAKTVFFTWEDKSGSVEYQLEIARDKDFKQIVKTKIGKEKIERIADLPAGNYFWHVKGRHPSRTNAPFSRLMSFAIHEGARLPVAPQLTSTDLNYTIPESVLAKFSSESAKTGRGVKPLNIVPLTWPKTDNASSYEVEVALDENFTNSVRHDNGASTQFTPQEVRPGPLFMRVRAQSQDGRMGPVSPTAKLNVWLPAPVMEKVKPVVATFKSEKELEEAQTEFNLAWKPQKFAAGYELQWGADPEFSKSKTFKVSETSRLLKVSKPEAYAARVRSLDADGHPISPYSFTAVASYKKDLFIPPVVLKPKPKPEPRLPASAPKILSDALTPVLREPAAASALVSLEDAPTFVSFKWKPFKGAASYTIQISSDADFTKVISEKDTTSNGYVFQSGLPEGKVFWRVRAKTKQGITNWSDPSDIKVIYQ